MEDTARAHRSTAGRRFPADPPRVEEIIAVMREAGDGCYGRRLRGVIVVLWRAGLRISEALALAETDLEPTRGALLVRRGKGGKRREVGMDDWAWEQLRPWLELRILLPVGPLLCAVSGATAGDPGQARPRATASSPRGRAGVRRRFAPHQLRHAHAVEMAREGVPLNVIQRELGHANFGVTSIYLQGIDTRKRSSARFIDGRRRPCLRVPRSLDVRVRMESGYFRSDHSATTR